MKTTKLTFLALLVGVSFTVNAQTITLTSATPATGTFGSNNSVHIGTSSGNGTSSSGGDNTFVGTNSGRINTTGSGNSFFGMNSGFNCTESKDNVLIGVNAGFENSGSRNVFTGVNSGYYNKADENCFYGYMSGHNNYIGKGNSFFGFQSGRDNETADNNTFLGYYSGTSTTSGGNNTFIGWATGVNNIDGEYNTFVGRSAGDQHKRGNYNTIVGSLAGWYGTSGWGNVFLGFGAGRDEMGSGKLYIENSGSASPLIWGDFESDQLKFNGKVGIGGDSITGFGNFPTVAGGVDVSNYQLFVYGGILTEEVRVNLRGTSGEWADYVFNKDYNLKPLSEVEKFINDNGHLPNVPSAAQVKEEGIELGNMAKIQQEKIEELTLYIIEQNKINEKQGKEIEELKRLVNVLICKK